MLCIVDVYVPLDENMDFYERKNLVIWYIMSYCMQSLVLLLYFDIKRNINFIYCASILYTFLSSVSGLTLIYLYYSQYLVYSFYVQYCFFRCIFNLSSFFMLLFYSLYSYFA